MDRLLSLLRRLLAGDERALARHAQRQMLSPEERELRRFAKQLEVKSDAAHLTFGQVEVRGRSRDVGLPTSTALATHLAIGGGSGTGKTTLALLLLWQLLVRAEARLFGVDPKGDLSDGLRTMIFPAVAASSGGVSLIDRLRYLRLFAREASVPLRLTAREPGVPIEVQALSLATALGEASGVELSVAATPIFTKLAYLAIELDYPLTTIVTWLSRPEIFAREARRSQNDDLRHYAVAVFPREHRGSLRSLRTRLESVLLLPSVRSAVEAPTCISLERSLEEHHLLIDLSHPRPGEEPAVRLLGSPLLGRLTRAILNRHVDDTSSRVILAIDELPELLGRFETKGMARLAALARSHLVTLLTLNQQSVQLGRELSQVLRTNFSVEAVFRCNARDAESLAHVLPVPSDARHPAEARRALVRRLITLPRRHYMLWLKDQPIPAHFVRAPRMDIQEFERIASSLKPEIRERLGAWANQASEHSTSPIPKVKPTSSSLLCRRALPEPSTGADDGFPPLG